MVTGFEVGVLRANDFADTEVVESEMELNKMSIELDESDVGQTALAVFSDGTRAVVD